jgi:hypothetical protein
MRTVCEWLVQSLRVAENKKPTLIACAIVEDGTMEDEVKITSAIKRNSWKPIKLKFY